MNTSDMIKTDSLAAKPWVLLVHVFRRVHPRAERVQIKLCSCRMFFKHTVYGKRMQHGYIKAPEKIQLLLLHFMFVYFLHSIIY